MSDGFPPIIPMVLYHGVSRWHAAKRFLRFSRYSEKLRPFFLISAMYYMLCA
ncbi:MAG: Rpn family recombination-promoting nuclease/putative transposase [Deltaproteobacteria bacterium]|nr:Rpn family recombination-promoting nuclease/putative transposase [Deltaproteobacteria bacterium]